jgi:hypothetical protein
MAKKPVCIVPWGVPTPRQHNAAQVEPPHPHIACFVDIFLADHFSVSKSKGIILHNILFSTRKSFSVRNYQIITYEQKFGFRLEGEHTNINLNERSEGKRRR